MACEEKPYSKKHPEGITSNPEIQTALETRLTEQELPCAVAFEVASDLNVSPDEVGINADLLEIPLVKCQLGLFGYTPKKCIIKAADTVSDDLRAAIEQGLVNGRLPCAAAWKVAKNLGLRKMAVSSACEGLGIKIGPCQLGAF